MMYSPEHYSEDRSELILETIKRYSFATIITQGEAGPFVSHLPLILEHEIEGAIEGQTLIGHCARANPQWRHFAEGQEATIIFHGPHAYISPAWYEPQIDNVPTWNYVAVHLKGSVQIIESSAEAYRILQTMVHHFESGYGTNWNLPSEPNSELEGLVNAIVAFRIEIKEIQAKFKLSQKQTQDDRANVIDQLPKFAGAEGSALAEYMKLASLI
jgi:transcriptional regulator